MGGEGKEDFRSFNDLMFALMNGTMYLTLVHGPGGGHHAPLKDPPGVVLYCPPDEE